MDHLFGARQRWTKHHRTRVASACRCWNGWVAFQLLGAPVYCYTILKKHRIDPSECEHVAVTMAAGCKTTHGRQSIEVSSSGERRSALGGVIAMLWHMVTPPGPGEAHCVRFR